MDIDLEAVEGYGLRIFLDIKTVRTTVSGSSLRVNQDRSYSFATMASWLHVLDDHFSFVRELLKVGFQGQIVV